MRLLSASEDLTIRTLKHLKGSVRRLLYIVTLRDQDGNYQHWGMSQVFGDEATKTAAQEAHKEALNEILRKPLAELWSELASSKEATPPSEPLRQLAQSGTMVVPPGTSEAAACHLSSVLLALRELAHGSKGSSSRPAA